MEKNIVKNNKIINILIFIINPFIGFIIALLKYITSNQNIYLYLITIFFALFGYNYIPTIGFDIIHHYEEFNKVVNMDFTKLNFYLNSRKDSGIYYYYWFLSFISKKHQIIGFFTAGFYYFVPFYILKNLKQKIKIKKAMFILFIILFFSLTPTYKFSGMRNGAAMMLFSLGFYKSQFECKRIGYFFIGLTPIVHSSFLVILPVVLLSRIVKVNKLTSIISLASIIFSILYCEKILIFALKFLNIFGKKQDVFKWTLEVYLKESNKYVIAANKVIVLVAISFTLIMLVIFYFNILFLKDSRNKGIKELEKFLLIYFPFLGMTSFSYPIFDRYNWNIYILLIIYLIFFIMKKIPLQLKKYVFVLIAAFSMVSIYYIVVVENKNWNPKLIYYTLPKLLSNEVKKNEYNN